jgi:hypothetical protein
MSFDAAKIRRFFELNKQSCVIVREHSRFVDTYQISAQISIFLYFPIKLAGICRKMRNFAR